jgi:hypothetical protein
MSSELKTMMWQHRAMRAKDLARDFVVTAQAFADTFIQYVAADGHGEMIARVGHRRRETCAAVWAAVVATFDASALTEDEKARVVPLVRETMFVYWAKYCGSEMDTLAGILERSAHYLRHSDRGSQLKTATAILNELVASLDEEGARLLPVRTLTALLAHRMLSDLRRLNEIRAGHAIE